MDYDLSLWGRIQAGWGAIGLVRERLGAGQAAAVLAEVVDRGRRGEPFEHLAPAGERREEACRGQVGPAILLYRALKKRLPPEDVLELMERVMIKGALVYMRKVLGGLTRERLCCLNAAGREQLLRQMGARFANTTLEWESFGPGEVRFRAVRCRFVELCRSAHAAELAPYLCAGDREYFDRTPGIEFLRPRTLADGAKSCDFVLYWKKCED